MLTIQMRPLASLFPYVKNARTHSDEQIALIATSITEFGFTNPILAAPDGEIIAGHGRLLAAARLRLEEVPVIVLDHLTPTQRRALVLADNQIAANAGWDEALLAGELKALEDEGFNLDLIGFSDEQLDELMEGLGGETHNVNFQAGSAGPVAGEDDVPPTPAVAVTEPGDVWIMGPHRLVCGSCTDPAAVRAVLGAAQPNLMVTDPPYGVDYDPQWRNDAAEKGILKMTPTERLGVVSNDDRADWREAWALFPGAIAYVWHGGKASGVVHASLEAAKFEIRSQIIWNKPQIVIGRGHYHWKHEPCFYAVREGSTGNWQGDRKQSTIWDIEGNRRNSNGENAPTLHSTQKPVECMRRPLINHTVRGDAVYDPFMGSGSSLIACEAEGRVSLGCELAPVYVDIAVRRWMGFCDGEPVLESTGQTFEEVAAARAEARAAAPPAAPTVAAPKGSSGRTKKAAPAKAPPKGQAKGGVRRERGSSGKAPAPPPRAGRSK